MQTIVEEDPHDKKFLTICFVCKNVAKQGQEHLRNYGGIVCFSCRAFWRRSHQNSKNPEFQCKKNNLCTITVLNRRRCQKCRYERCLLAGMKPGAVLDTNQKKIRFRKLLKKQQKILSLQKKGKVPIPATLRYFHTTYQGQSRSRQTQLNGQTDDFPISTGNQGSSSNEDTDQHMVGKQGEIIFERNSYQRETMPISRDESIFSQFPLQVKQQDLNSKVFNMTLEFNRIMNTIG